MKRPEPAPLRTVDMPVPHWRALDRARRRADVLRSTTGRLATLAGGGAAATGLFTGDFTGAFLLATAALSSAGVGTLRVWKPDGHQRATATVLYLLPGAGLAALLAAEQVVPGIHWGEALGLTTWLIGTWVARPARLARQMMSPRPVAVPETGLAVVQEPVADHPAAEWWARTVAVEGGVAPGTALEAIERTGETSMRAVIRSTVAGQPVPEISIRRLSALMDVPEDAIGIGPVPRRGASVRLLTVGQPDEDASPEAVWAKRIAPLAMPGTVLTSARSGRPATETTDPEG
ncbi:hypothetical protein ACIBEJ_34215 [Nonomuraea sp. NPDC050790]|uniref:hypothetical protein n=1 Tax=Nonomuraea sp. NPDC050790 TaxID=3364371 RepID=UPI0037A39A67